MIRSCWWAAHSSARQDGLRTSDSAGKLPRHCPPLGHRHDVPAQHAPGQPGNITDDGCEVQSKHGGSAYLHVGLPETLPAAFRHEKVKLNTSMIAYVAAMRQLLPSAGSEQPAGGQRSAKHASR